MKDLTCPYCGHEQDAYDIEGNGRNEVECEKCEKLYGVTVEYAPVYSEYIMPCANGEAHTMKKGARAPRVINGCEYWFCVHCDYTEERPSKCSETCTANKVENCWKCSVKEEE